jgi:hypothetical protein
MSAVREFIAVLQLHETYTAPQIAAAIEAALADNIAHLAGIIFCLHKLNDTTPQLSTLEVAPQLAAIGTPPVPASQYNQLLRRLVA